MTFPEFKDIFLKEEIEEYPNTITNNPVASVCIQTYNHAKYISACLDSILAQKVDFEFEILLGEDDSNDETRDICMDYAKKHPNKIRLFLHKRKNNIKVKNISTGLFPALYNFFIARGQFIAYCDGDDLWGDTQKLQKQIDFLVKNPKYSMCFHQFKTLESNSSSFKPKQITRDISQQQLLQVALHPLIITFCFKKLENLPFEITKVINADSFLISLLGQQGEGKYMSDIKPSLYRFHDGGLYSSKKKEQRFLMEAKTYSILSEYYKDKPDLHLYFQKKVFNYQKMSIVFYFKTFQFKKLFIHISNIIFRNRNTIN